MNNTYESVDVLIFGAGLSGIGAACQLRRMCPDRSLMVMESRDAIGGTWDLFRYPGIRSDSDMYTFSYGFKPWLDDSAIADGDKIRDYICEAAREYDVEPHIRYQHKVVSANWSPSDKRWLVTAERGDTGERVSVSCRFVFNCTGYYDYDEGYTPEFEGIDDFSGQLIHAQHWPEELDYRGKRVVVIGSGATAITLVPSMAKDTASITMLQRSPTYIAHVPAEDPTARIIKKWLPKSWVFRLMRWKKVVLLLYIYRMSRKKPAMVRKYLLGLLREELGQDYDIETHFTPHYNPWDQRLCASRDGDLFTAIREGRAEVVTDHIECFNEQGITLKSGKQLEADIVVLATGLNLKFAGGIAYSVDDKVLDLKEHFIYRGMMFSDVPNMAFTVGYTNSSWTLKADLVSAYVCRLLNKMAASDKDCVTPRINGSIGEAPLLDFDAGYVLRSRDQMPKQGDRFPWKMYQNYIKDFISMRLGRMDKNELEIR